MYRKVDVQRTTSETTPRRLKTAEQRSIALALRLAGATFEQIGQKLGITDSAAHKLVKKALADNATTTNDQTDTLRQIEIERLDMALLAIAQQVKAGNLGAIDRWVKISESRRRLMGLDAPTKASNQNWDMSTFSDEELAQIAAGADPAAVVAGRKL